jgi:hypothetical protein
MARTLRTLSGAEIELVPGIIEGAKPLFLEGTETTSRSITTKLEAAIAPDKLILDGMVSPEMAFPYSTLAHI